MGGFATLPDGNAGSIPATSTICLGIAQRQSFGDKPTTGV